MKRRMIQEYTGLGGNAPTLLDNKGKLSRDIKKMMKEAFDLWKPLQYGADYQFSKGGFAFGIEPTYQFEPLFIIYIDRDKKHSFIKTGRAVEAWASKVISTTRVYKDFKYQSKFIRFIDKWHNFLFSKTK